MAVCGIRQTTIALMAICLFAPSAPGAPAPPSNVQAVDTPSDGGGKIDVTWDLSPDDASLSAYRILRSKSETGPFAEAGVVNAGKSTYTDAAAKGKEPFFYQVVAVAQDDTVSTAAASNPATAVSNWFNKKATGFLVMVSIVSGSVIMFIYLAGRGMSLKIRKIAGLDSVIEAVGRATEMGRPVLFIPGIQDLNDIQTIAGLTILGRVATTIAEHDAELEVPTSRSLVMTAARETVKASYLAAGRPEAYSDDMVYYTTDEQFGYVAAVTGIQVRKKPAACIYMGAFYAESLILAETGNSIGAIQIAGTAMPAQLPFFVAACDYTLIGEEFFAASAYLSGETKQLGSLKGQDVGKLLAMMLIGVGVTLATIISVSPTTAWAERTLSWMMQNVFGTGVG